jgi:hypothetical protein
MSKMLFRDLPKDTRPDRLSFRTGHPKDILDRKRVISENRESRRWTDSISEARNRVYDACVNQAGYNLEDSSPAHMAIVYDDATGLWKHAQEPNPVTQPGNTTSRLIKKVTHDRVTRHNGYVASVTSPTNKYRGGSW